MEENQKTGFFEEAPNQKSAMRLIFICGSFWCMLLVSYLAIVAKATPAELIAVFSSIMGVLLGGKLIQKSQENKTT